MFNCRNQITILFDGTVITQPNQAFTPRQILEQFARNEIVPSYNESSDSLSDDNYKDDDLLDGDVVEFDDAMEAQSYIQDNQFQPYEEKQSTVTSGDGTPSGTTPTDPGAQQPAGQVAD